MYGSTFASLWAGIPVHEVKAQWQESLAPYTGAKISWAIDAVGRECDMAPTLPRFLRFCRQAPQQELVATLPDNGVGPSPRISEILRGVLKSKDESITIEDRACWAVRVLAKIAAGEKPQGKPFPTSCEINAVEALTDLQARHLAPAEYVAMNRSVWMRDAQRKRI